MGRRSIKFTEEKIAERIRAGHGRGTGPDYKGWFTIRDFSTSGIATRFPSPELGRTLLFLSNIELHAHLIAASKGFCDYWEQYPMDREETTDIAKALGVRHPVYFGTTQPVIMTLDGVASYPKHGGIVREVLDCKPRFRLSNPRTQEKLAIHAEYARRRGWTYRRFTEHSAPAVVIQNLEWMRSAYEWADDLPQVELGFDMWAMRLYRTLRESLGEAVGHQVRAYCYAFDAQHQLPSGCGLRCLRLLLLHGLIEFDLELPHLTLLRGPLKQLSITERLRHLQVRSMLVGEG